jgi:hypothetical protein
MATGIIGSVVAAIVAVCKSDAVSKNDIMHTLQQKEQTVLGCFCSYFVNPEQEPVRFLQTYRALRTTLIAGCVGLVMCCWRLWIWLV